MMSPATRATVAALLLSFPLLSPQAMAEETPDYALNLKEKLHEILQLNRETMTRIGPVIQQLEGCVIDQKELLSEEFSLNNLYQAQRACTPLIEKMVSEMGFTTEEQKDEASSKLYRELIKGSI